MEECSTEHKPWGTGCRRSTHGIFNATGKRLHSKRDAKPAYDLEIIDKDDSDDDMRDDTYTCK